MTGMTLDINEQNDGAIIRVSGRVMFESDSNEFKQHLEDEIERGKQWFVIDLSNVVAMSSTGLGILIGAHRYIIDKGGKFKLAQISDKVRSILEITRLNSVFEIFDSVETALETVKEE